MKDTKAENTQNKTKEFRSWAVYLVCLGVASVFMFAFGLNSPLHTFNPHCDYQWYMTMGHGIVSGKVIYRDLFDHKGPITYLVFAFACLFPNPQIAIWLIEILCVSWFLFFCYRIARKFLSPWLALSVVPLMMMALSTNYARGIEGACVEEYCLPIFAYGLLTFLDFLIDRKPVSWRRSLTLGVCYGILFWTKFTMLEFFVVPLLIWVIVNIVEHKFLTVVRSGLVMLGGFALVALPIVIGFAVLGALPDLFEIYFLVNIGKYGVGNLNHEYNDTWFNFGLSLLLGTTFALLWFVGLIGFAINYWRQKSGWLLLIAALSSWLMVGLIGAYLFYYLPLYAYAVLGVVYLIKIVACMLQNASVIVQRRKFKLLWLSVVAVASFFVALPLATNTVEINQPRDHYAPLVVADILAEYNQTAERPATLFCYRMADGGFYNAAGIVPTMKYYAHSSFSEAGYPAMFQAFDETIRNQSCDFVVTYPWVYEAKQDFLTQYYHLYKEGDLQANTIPYRYFEPSGYEESSLVILFRN